MRAAPSTTVREAAAAWLAGARDGSIRNRSGDVYKPSAIRGYDAALKKRILPDLGGAKLSSPTSRARTCRTLPTGCSRRGPTRRPSATRSCRCG
jgi:hypothetical protein